MSNFSAHRSPLVSHRSHGSVVGVLRTSLLEVPETPWAQRRPGVTPKTCGAVGDRAQVILVWARAPWCWQRLPPTETKKHKGKAISYA